MVTRLMLLGAVLLFSSGCATYQTRSVYNDGYYAGGGSYVDRDGSRYAPAHSGYGDYYVGRRDYRYVDSYYYPAYLQWPAYHSLFWGFSRWYHDPFFYPGYYYGVTYFPHNYLSFSARRGLFAFGAGHRYFPYSPYRFAWHDTYYDWSFWHHHYASHRHHQRGPRYGSARNEAERLAWRARTSDNRVLRQAASDSTRLNERRRADYGNRVQSREDTRMRAAGDQSRQSQRSGESLQQRERGASAPTRVIRPSNERPNERAVDRSRALAQPAARERHPAIESRPEQQRAAPEPRAYREAPVASRTAPTRAEARAPQIRDNQPAPQVRQVQLPRAYAGRDDYERAPPRQGPARPQQDYRRAAPTSAPSAYSRQTRPVVSHQGQQQGQQQIRTAPHSYQQTYQQQPRVVDHQTRAYSAPQQAPQQSRQPARAERSGSATRSEAREPNRKPREDR